MGNWRLARTDEPRTLTRETLKAYRHGRPAGLSRRQLIRRSLGAGVGLWLLEVTGGTIGFLWPNLAGGFGGVVELGDLETVAGSPATSGATLQDGAPAYFQAARTFVQLIDPNRGFIPGESPNGDGTAINVRTMYQRCPHLGCKPNFCLINYWFECPCHGSRYDRLGIKILELGPAPRGLDRFAASVSRDGILIVDTGKITLGPLPVALGQPGLIPPKSPTGCL
ncbi:MAG TPA: Rieske 2Fe-2S domain-containing protein [Candidatus Limnocylindrales bacterium]|jgi:cytochrome b6-f complex iron-sulfur subunit|nr:Rieske 2Fe-2S domain-containing protein [Candidatus Limnocylindrales bacterium]